MGIAAVTVALVSFVLAKAAAQTPGTLPTRFQHLTQQDGLVQTAVVAITQDSLEFLWFGTWDGLYRYDGTGLRRFAPLAFDSTSLVYSSVKGLATGAGGNVYVSTDGGGLDLYDARTETFRRACHAFGTPCNTGDRTTQSLGNTPYGTFFDQPSGLLSRIDPKHETISTVNADATRLDGRAFAYAAAPDGRLWVGTLSGYLHAFGANGALRRTELRDAGGAPTFDPIRGLHYDAGSRLYVATDGGLRVLDLATGAMLPIPEALRRRRCTAITPGVAGELWIGTWEGLVRLDPAHGQVTEYRHNPRNPTSLLAGEVYSLYLDRQQVLWVGTRTGVSRLPLTGARMGGRFDEAYDLENASPAGVWHFCKTRDGDLWVLLERGIDRYDPSGRLVRTYLPRELGIGTAADNTLATLRSLHLAADGTLLVQGIQGEPRGYQLARFDPVLGQPRGQVAFTSANTSDYGDSPLPALRNDGQPQVWSRVAGQRCPTRYVDSLQRYVRYCPPADSPEDSVRQTFSTVVQARNGLTYFGAYQSGILVFDSRADTWRRYRYNQNDPRGLPSDIVLDLAEDSRGGIWAGTYGAGLSRLDPEAGTFVHYDSKNSALANEVVYSVVVDARDRVWVATNYGISVLDQGTGQFFNFGLEHGLQNMEFNAAAKYVAADGEVFFGGISGFNRFYPDSLLSHGRAAPVVLTGVNVRGEPWSSPGAPAAPFLSALSLAAAERDVEISFAALEFAFPAATRIRYRLVGYAEDWTEAGPRRSVSYTNLDPGRYRFEVQAANGTGEFDGATATLDIDIRWPWWRTWWAYGAYALLVGGAAYILYGFRQNRLRERQRLVRQRAEAAQLRELDRVKTNFFTNVSHEFRTPLTLISGPLDDLLRTDELALLPPRHRQNLTLARENAGRLNELVEELLDISQLEAGHLRSRPSAIEVEPFLELMLYEHRQLAARKGVRLRVEGIGEDLPTVTADPQHLQRILGNLVSNGIKFTPSGGQVVLEVRVGGVSSAAHSLEPVERGPAACVHFTVRDTGRGIPAADLPNVFDRFYRVDESDASRTIGTGIGLSLARELARLEHGELNVTSTEGSGSRFSLSLPLSRGAEADVREDAGPALANPAPITVPIEALPRSPMPTAFVQPANHLPHGFTPAPVPATSLVPASTRASAPATAAVLAKDLIRLPDAEDERPSVLVVEDHARIRAYIAQQLSDDYRVLEAADGAEGILIAEQFLPDLIVSDVMMPIKDGLELCDTLKASVHTGFIPIVLLTARSARHQRLEGLRHQADAYLTKPFDAEELALVIDKLIQERRRWRERLVGAGRVSLGLDAAGKVTVLPEGAFAASSSDADASESDAGKSDSVLATASFRPAKARLTGQEIAFLKEVDAALHECHGDETWTVEGFAERLHVSRSHLHRLLVDLLDRPPSQLLREYRLQRAAALLDVGEGNVSEVAYAVGFKSVAHFSNAFTELYGVRPSGWGERAAV